MGKRNLKNKGKKQKESKGKDNSNNHDNNTKNVEKSNKKSIAHLLVKKKKLIPLEKIKLDKVYTDSDIQTMPINKLKKLASEFDLNPKINFKLLEYLLKNEKDEYDKYIKKYKYTLEYKDAKELNCFNSEFVKKMEQLYINNLSKSNNNYIDKSGIESLSKITLFNLIFYYININDLTDLKKIERDIKEYSLDVFLIFKAPNKFGNVELKFYTLLRLYVELVLSIILKLNNEANNDLKYGDINSKDSEENVYFDWETDEIGEEVEIDMIEFEQRKSELIKYIGNYSIEYAEEYENKDKINEMNIENNNNIAKKEKDQTNSNNINTIKTPSKRKESEEKRIEMKFFQKELHIILIIFKRYKNIINELILEKDNLKIIHKLKSIYYSFIFNDDSNMKILDEFINCLSETPHTKEEIVFYSFNKDFSLIDEKCEENNYSMFAIKNLDSIFSKSIYNPFINNSKYYRYPYNFEKNILKNNEELFSSFLKLIKIIFKSKIIKDIYYLNPEFKDFAFPLDNDEIINEIMNNTILFPFNSSKTYGFTQKEFPLVLIAVNMIEYENNINVSKILCIYSQIINSYIHEQVKHYLKSLIFYNSFRFKIKKRINSDLFNFGEEEYFIEGLRQKFNGQKKIKKIPIDGGEKAEIYLYGEILGEIKFHQAIELFKISNWDKTIPQHIELFRNSPNKNNNEEFTNIEFLKKNNDYSEFFIKVIEIFDKIKKLKGFYYFNYNDKSGKINRKNELEEDEVSDKNLIKFDYSDYAERPVRKIPDSSLQNNIFYNT